MRNRILGMLAMGMLAVPTANAAPVTWQFAAVIDTVNGSDVDPAVVVGNPLTFNLNFDTATPVTNPAGCGSGGVGTLCRHNGDPSLSFTNVATSTFMQDFIGDVPLNSITVRNDALFGVDIVDGYSFGGTEINGSETLNFVLIIRGPENLGIVTDGRVLPSDPPAGLLGLGTRVFEICNSSTTALSCDIGYLSATLVAVRRVAVAEPGSLALLSLGLMGIGCARRRKPI